MDRSKNLHELFSRGSTPPVPPAQHQPYGGQHHSYSTSPNQIDSLFHNLSAPPVQQPGKVGGNTYGNSVPTTPIMSRTDDSMSSSLSAPNNSTADRQSALLSLLGTVPAGANTRSAAGAGPPLPQQVPTPPGSSQRSGASPNNSESQGKILLEQLMSG